MLERLGQDGGSRMTTICSHCATPLVAADSRFCHHCGQAVATHDTAISDAPGEIVADELPAIKLHGLYDDRRREELALAVIPILAGLADRIDMTDVEHIDLAALQSLIPLMEAKRDEHAPPIDVIGMNDDVLRSLERAEFERFFRCI
jgi:anti-anti-sigma regulatory factor